MQANFLNKGCFHPNQLSSIFLDRSFSLNNISCHLFNSKEIAGKFDLASQPGLPILLKSNNLRDSPALYHKATLCS